jgi:PAS domain S-box-containing protein
MTEPQEGAARTANVLLVEDTMVQRLAIAALLEKHGYKVEAAADGHEAMHLLESRRNPADLVITDIGMPRMNGINLCRNIKRNPKTKHLPVIMLTGFDDERNHRSAVDAGAADFVTKPVTERELIYRLEFVLSSSTREAQSQQVWHSVMFEALPDAILVSDGNDQYIDANPAACAMLGYTRDELLRLDGRAVAAQSANWLETRRLRLNEAGTWRGRSQVRHKRGVLFWVDANMALTSFQGEPVYLAVLRPAEAPK